MWKKYYSLLPIIIITLLLIFLGAPFFNWVATNKWNWLFIDNTNYDTWIGYYGTILGGFLTLVGVWWTIKEENDKREKEAQEHEQEKKDLLSAQYKPILTVGFFPQDADNYPALATYENYITQNAFDLGDLKDCTKDNCIISTFCLYNIGRGEAHSIENITLIAMLDNHQVIWKKNSEIKEYALFAGNKIEFLLGFKISDDIVQKILSEKFMSFHITLCVDYKDLVGKKYKLVSLITTRKLGFDLNEKEKVFLFKYDIEYSFITNKIIEIEEDMNE